MGRRGATILGDALKRMSAEMVSADLRMARGEAHRLFDQLWKGGGHMTRTQAYEWLQKKMGLPPHAAHISQFNYEQCAQVCEAVQEQFPWVK